jgi:hypothetical protein
LRLKTWCERVAIYLRFTAVCAAAAAAAVIAIGDKLLWNAENFEKYSSVHRRRSQIEWKFLNVFFLSLSLSPFALG